jgi:hypothetical protein
MLAKTSEQSGTGLGAESRGIITAIETKVPPENMDIAFKGSSKRGENLRRLAEGQAGEDEDRT